MSINFPSSPTDQQSYTDPTSGVTFIYYATPGVWKNVKNAITVSASQPTQAYNGDIWVEINNGIVYTYANTGLASYWIEWGPDAVQTDYYLYDAGAPNTVFGTTIIAAGGVTG